MWFYGFKYNETFHSASEVTVNLHFYEETQNPVGSPSILQSETLLSRKYHLTSTLIVICLQLYLNQMPIQLMLNGDKLAGKEII